MNDAEQNSTVYGRSRSNPKTSLSAKDTSYLSLALSRASLWFQIHADQRMKLIGFYIVLLAGLITGFATALDNEQYLWLYVITVILFVLTFAFKCLDQRVACLLKDAESALDEIEQEIAAHTPLSLIRLTRAAEKKSRKLSYRQAFNLVFGLGYWLALFGTITTTITYFGLTAQAVTNRIAGFFS